MNFTVVWTPEAEHHLATIWLAATDKNAVTRASNAIDIALASTPNALGVAVFDTVREYAHPPLAVEYEVIDPDREVVVLTVWDINQGRPPSTGN